MGRWCGSRAVRAPGTSRCGRRSGRGPAPRRRCRPTDGSRRSTPGARPRRPRADRCPAIPGGIRRDHRRRRHRDSPAPRGPLPARRARTGGRHRRAVAERPALDAVGRAAVRRVYLILLAHQLDARDHGHEPGRGRRLGPVIGELFGAAPGHANVVLGEFGWYATLLFDLGTKWLPGHRQIWEAAPRDGAGGRRSPRRGRCGRWPAGGRRAVTAVVLICASPATLRLELSTTQHAPAWFCLALLGAFVVWLELEPTAYAPAGAGPAGARRRDDRRRQRRVGSAADHRGAAPFALAMVARPRGAADCPRAGERRGHARGRGRHLGDHAGRDVGAVGHPEPGPAHHEDRSRPQEPPQLHAVGAVDRGARQRSRLWRLVVARLSWPPCARRLASRARARAPVAGWRRRLRAPIASGRTRSGPATLFLRSGARRRSCSRSRSSSATLRRDIHSDRYLVGLLYAAAAVVPAAVAPAGAGVDAGACPARTGRSWWRGSACSLSAAAVSMARPHRGHRVPQPGQRRRRPPDRADRRARATSPSATPATGTPPRSPGPRASACRFTRSPFAIRTPICAASICTSSAAGTSPRPRTGSFLLTDIARARASRSRRPTSAAPRPSTASARSRCIRIRTISRRGSL